MQSNASQAKIVKHKLTRSSIVEPMVTAAAVPAVGAAQVQWTELVPAGLPASGRVQQL